MLQAICSLGAKTKGFSNFTPLLADFLVAQGVKVLEDVAPSLARAPAELSRLVTIVDDELPKDSASRHTFLHALARAASSDNPSLQSLFNNCPMWVQLFKLCGSAPDAWVVDTPLNGLLKRVHKLLFDTARQIAGETVVLRTLHTVLRSSAEFTQLMEQTGCKVLSADNLQARSRSLQTFDTTLAEVQCFVTLFCGAQFDTTRLRERVTQLTKE